MNKLIKIWCLVCVMLLVGSNLAYAQQGGFFKKLWGRMTRGKEEEVKTREVIDKRVEEPVPIEEGWGYELPPAEKMVVEKETIETPPVPDIPPLPTAVPEVAPAPEAVTAEEELPTLEIEPTRELSRGEMLDIMYDNLDTYGEELVKKIANLVRKVDAEDNVEYLFRASWGEELPFEKLDDETLRSLYQSIGTEASLMRFQRIDKQLRATQIPTVPQTATTPSTYEIPRIPQTTVPEVPKVVVPKVPKYTTPTYQQVPTPQQVPRTYAPPSVPEPSSLEVPSPPPQIPATRD
jgi:hypothetical protein